MLEEGVFTFAIDSWCRQPMPVPLAVVPVVLSNSSFESVACL